MTDHAYASLVRTFEVTVRAFDHPLDVLFVSTLDRYVRVT
jgi:hypothetical protein